MPRPQVLFKLREIQKCYHTRNDPAQPSGALQQQSDHPTLPLRTEEGAHGYVFAFAAFCCQSPWYVTLVSDAIHPYGAYAYNHPVNSFATTRYRDNSRYQSVYMPGHCWNTALLYAGQTGKILANCSPLNEM